MNQTPDEPIALLIDGENISYLLIGRILGACEHYGSATIRRVYLKRPSVGWQPKGAWYDAAACYDAQIGADVPAQAGGNAVDIALAVGAMDLFHAGFRQFCLATSDSDFVALVARLRTANCMVLLIGNVTTSRVLRESPTCFVETTHLPAPVPWSRLWEIVEVDEPEKRWRRETLRKRRRDGSSLLLPITTVDVELLQAEANG